jgi:hypothetical protein
MCNPSFKNVFKIDPFGLAFIAYLTVNPYAFGNAFALAACFFSVCKSYTYAGVPNSSFTCFASDGDKNRSCSRDDDEALRGDTARRLRDDDDEDDDDDDDDFDIPTFLPR